MILLAMLATYGALHAYAFAKTKAAFSLRPVPAVLLGCAMASMVCAPNLVRLLETGRLEPAARLVSTVGYGWMGVLLFFVPLHLAADLLRGVYRKAVPARIPDAPVRRRRSRIRFLTILALALSLFHYGLLEAGDVRVETIVLKTRKLPEEIGRLRIVHISDVHLNLVAQGKRVEKLASLVAQAAPDILVSTGDLVDSQMECLSEMLEGLKRIEPRYGKYAVTGNHEFLSGVRHALSLTQRAGFTVLRNEAVAVAGMITIAGVDDAAGRSAVPPGGASGKGILPAVPGNAFVLLLKHQPCVDGESQGRFDLQLSGHTHGGQIFPFGLAARLFFPYSAGLHELPGGSHLYVSRGAGTCGPPVRLLSPPEITVIDLVHGA